MLKIKLMLTKPSTKTRIALFGVNFEPPKICLWNDFDFSHICYKGVKRVIISDLEDSHLKTNVSSGYLFLPINPNVWLYKPHKQYYGV